MIVWTADVQRPWWERYQVVSYKLVSRSGTEGDFRRMAWTCHRHGLRIYPNVQLKFMAMAASKGVGTGGTRFNADWNTPFPGVPYSNDDFMRMSEAYCDAPWGTNATQMRNCGGRMNLNQSRPDVQDKLAGFLNHLVDLGADGFRVDSASGQWPLLLKAILDKVKDITSGGRPFVILEVPNTIQHAVKPSEYFMIGHVTEFEFAERLGEAIMGDFRTLGSVVNLSLPMVPSDHALIFVDNHDIQRGRQRKGATILTHRDPHTYKLGQAFTLAYNYGMPRVMSSYYFSDNEEGPPHHPYYGILDVIRDVDGHCSNGWVCEHRWPAISAMVRFRNHVCTSEVKNWQVTEDTVAFSRGDRGFLAMGRHKFSRVFQTGLPAGVYCDIISDCKVNVTVNAQGLASVTPYARTVGEGQQDNIVAILNEKLPAWSDFFLHRLFSI
ncbi:alpha-amylase 1 [Aplysia californica]|uniref:alpha-amylase n=1 Tax=Aplysia californica TaxID=6500 RepID=A0ABM1VV83_APLCA|nr:alpha-amylase 1 [Aplysia californica]